jgi:tetratricopeptide (TPR) repeat protein
MSTKKPSGREYPSDDAGKLMKRGDAAFRKGRMSKALALYDQAIEHLEVLWDATQNAQVGLRLADAHISACYPAWRKYLAHGTPKGDREKWYSEASSRERAGCDLGIQLATTPVSMSDEEIVGVICHLHNFAGDRLHYRRDADTAERYINEAYRLLEAQRPGDTMPNSLHFGFVQMQADIAYIRGEYDKALSLVDQVIADEQARVDRARRKKKKLPPPNWLKIPTELRAKIVEAKSKAQ